jgi:hypothetical protein
MKRWLLALAICCLTVPSAFGQGFDNINVPGIGPVTATVGFSPGPLVGCEVQSRFPAGQKITTPFVVYVIADRTSTHSAPLTLEFREILPNGRVGEREVSHFSFPAGVTGKCNTKQFDRIDEPGTHRFQWFYNGVEIGRLTVDVN